MKLVLVGVGSAIGGIARFALTVFIQRHWPQFFPAGTLVVNLLGSFLIVLIVESAARTQAISDELRLFLTTGLMGGFTTYSAFTLESLRLMQEGQWPYAAAYLIATLVGCLLAGAAAIAVARMLF